MLLDRKMFLLFIFFFFFRNGPVVAKENDKWTKRYKEYVPSSFYSIWFHLCHHFVLVCRLEIKSH